MSRDRNARASRTGVIKQGLKTIEVQTVLDKVCNLNSFRSAEEVIRWTSRLLRLNTHSTVTKEELREVEKLYLDEMVEEVESVPISQFVTARIFDHLRSYIRSPRMRLLLALDPLYREMAEVWTPIFLGFMHSVMRWSEGIAGEILIVARDATPFAPAAICLKDRLGWPGRIRVIHLDRSMLGIKDPLSEPYQDPSRHVIRRLKKDFMGAPKAYVDTGTYGTIPRRLTMFDWLQPPPYFFLFNSSNPFVWGYLNRVHDWINIDGPKIPDEFIWIAGDTVEGFPKVYKRARFEQKLGELPKLLAESTNYVRAVSSMLFYWNIGKVAETLVYKEINKVSPIIALYQKYVESTAGIGKPHIPYVFLEAIREWEKADDFLSIWGFKSLPPQLQFIKSSRGLG